MQKYISMFLRKGTLGWLLGCTKSMYEGEMDRSQKGIPTTESFCKLTMLI